MKKKMLTIIEAKLNPKVVLCDIISHFDVLWSLSKRDIALRYRQTLIGVAWVVLQPLLTALLLTLVFGQFAGFPSDGVPYIAFILISITAWNALVAVVQRSSGSLIANSSLVTKVFFPRVILPLAAVAGCLLDLVISLSAVSLFVFSIGFFPTWRILLLPLLMLVLAILGLAVGFWVAASSVKYRDFLYVLPFVLQLWLFTTPVVYSSTLIPKHCQMLVAWNPAFCIIEGFRWCLLGTNVLTYGNVSLGVGIILFLFITGFIFFIYREQDFSDIL